MMLGLSGVVTRMTDLFTVLTFVALAIFASCVALGVAWVAGGASRRRAARVVETVGPAAGLLAWLVAVVATAGSLYYSEVADLEPCVLCWYQRICMYPLVAILGIAWFRRDPAGRLYALPFLVVGPVLAGYHWLIERYPSLEGGVECSITARCSVPYFEELGFVTLAFMSLSAFLTVGALLLVERAADRIGAAEAAPEERALR